MKGLNGSTALVGFSRSPPRSSRSARRTVEWCTPKRRATFSIRQRRRGQTRTLMRHELPLSPAIPVLLMAVRVAPPADDARLVARAGTSELLTPRRLGALVRGAPLSRIAGAAQQEARGTSPTSTCAELHPSPPMDALSPSAATSIMLDARSSGSTRGATRCQPSRPSRSPAAQPRRTAIASPVSDRPPRSERSSARGYARSPPAKRRFALHVVPRCGGVRPGLSHRLATMRA